MRDISSLLLIMGMLISSVADIGGNKNSAIFPVLKGVALILVIWASWESVAIHQMVDAVVAHF